jgi:hypothetical protein
MYKNTEFPLNIQLENRWASPLNFFNNGMLRVSRRLLPVQEAEEPSRQASSARGRPGSDRPHHPKPNKRSAIRGQHSVLTSSRPAHMNPSTSGVIAPVY